MTDQILMTACLALALVAALLAGVFQSFSDFVMRALGSAPADGGIASMQRINITVMRSWFLAVFMLLVPAAAGLAVHALANLSGPAALAIVLAGGTYIFGAFGVTMLGNVPMNNRLADLPPGSDAANTYWQHYLVRWTRFNHLRMFACMATAVWYLYAAILLAGRGA